MQQRTTFDRFDLISGMEKDLETQKEESKQKLETLESQMSQVTADLSALKENDKNQELSSKLNELGTDLDAKMSQAESKMAEFMETFEKFQIETAENQGHTGKQLNDVETQIKSFQSSSEGTVQDVLEDAENLKVSKLLTASNIVTAVLIMTLLLSILFFWIVSC